MQAFVFFAGQLEAVTTDQAAANVPRPSVGEWEYKRRIDDAAKTLSDEEIKKLNDDGFFIRNRFKKAKA